MASNRYFSGFRCPFSFRVVVKVLLFTICISSCYGFDPSIPRDQVEERECIGTASGLSSSGTAEFHYTFLRKRYLGCTYVLGNLEITHLEHPSISYDLSFLKHIRYVSGYVLIGLVGEVNKIPLTSLEIIRGNDTFSFQDEEYSLMVALTARDMEASPAHGLTTLMMPKLKEISNGKVFFIQNPSLGYIDTIDWDRIVKGRFDAVQFGEEPYNQSVSNKTEIDPCNGLGMWGNDPSLCQEIYPSPMCDEACGTLCYGPSPDECCHDTCAVGCTGPDSDQCSHCRDYRFGKKCVPYCPDLEYYPLMQECIARDPPSPMD